MLFWKLSKYEMNNLTNIIYDFACEIIHNICHSFIINESYKCTCLEKLCKKLSTNTWFIYDETMTNMYPALNSVNIVLSYLEST